MQRVTLKTSTIFISKGDRTRVYRSVGEIPQELRKELEASTNGFNSATILIADRRGREEVRRALKGMPSALRTRFAPRLEAPEAPEAPAPQQIAAPEPVAEHAPVQWWKIAVPVAIGLATWAAFSLR
jgi:hypothetical protein